MDIEYTIDIWEEGGQFFAHATPLDVMSSGGTADQARTTLDEAVRLFLTTAAGKCSLEEVLREAATN
jgi:predicted RNase H-like HicB family nuclease